METLTKAGIHFLSPSSFARLKLMSVLYNLSQPHRDASYELRSTTLTCENDKNFQINVLFMYGYLSTSLHQLSWYVWKYFFPCFTSALVRCDVAELVSLSLHIAVRCQRHQCILFVWRDCAANSGVLCSRDCKHVKKNILSDLEQTSKDFLFAFSFHGPCYIDLEAVTCRTLTNFTEDVERSAAAVKFNEQIFFQRERDYMSRAIFESFLFFLFVFLSFFRERVAPFKSVLRFLFFFFDGHCVERLRSDFDCILLSRSYQTK